MSGGVRVYQHANFSGTSQWFGIGYHDMNEIQRGVGNDQVSSLKVQKGTKVRLFEHAGYKGRQLVFGAGDHDICALRKSELNDTLSSLIVEKEKEKYYLKHASTNSYMFVTEAKNWPCAKLAHKSHRFVFYEKSGKVIGSLMDLNDGDYYRVLALNTTYPNYEYVYSSDAGWIYCDQPSNDGKQIWKLHKRGDQLAFENAEWPGYYLGADDGHWCTCKHTCIVWWVPEVA